MQKSKTPGTGFAAALLFLAVTAGLPQTAWGENYRRKDNAASGSSFERSVDLNRFRSGNGEWDTQELTASGMIALHREHERILRELAEIREALNRIEEK